MKIRDYIRTDDIVISDFNVKVNEMIDNMCEAYKSSKHEAKYWFATYKSSKGVTGAVDKMITAFKKAKGRKCCMFKCCSQTLQSIVHTTKSTPLAEYDNTLFYEVIKTMLTFIIAEYNEAYECQIKLGAYKCLFSLFRCWDYSEIGDNVSFAFNIDDVNQTIEQLLDTNYKSLKFTPEMKKHITELDSIKASKQAISDEKAELMLKKPKTAEHLTMLWDENIKQIDKVTRVEEYWHCSRSTAVRYMQKFGLWTPVKINNNRDIKHDTKEFFDYSVKGKTQTKDPKQLQRIADIELEIKRLQQELKKLKSESRTSASLF